MRKQINALRQQLDTITDWIDATSGPTCPFHAEQALVRPSIDCYAWCPVCHWPAGDDTGKQHSDVRINVASRPRETR
jgi:hypothetical protein